MSIPTHRWFSQLGLQPAGDSVVIFYPDLSFSIPVQVSVSLPSGPFGTAATIGGLELRYFDQQHHSWMLPGSGGKANVSQPRSATGPGRIVVTTSSLHLSQWAVSSNANLEDLFRHDSSSWLKKRIFDILNTVLSAKTLLPTITCFHNTYSLSLISISLRLCLWPFQVFYPYAPPPAITIPPTSAAPAVVTPRPLTNVSIQPIQAASGGKSGVSIGVIVGMAVRINL